MAAPIHPQSIPKHEPTPSEIARATERIRSGWSKRELERRAVDKGPGPYTIPINVDLGVYPSKPFRDGDF